MKLRVSFRFSPGRTIPVGTLLDAGRETRAQEALREMASAQIA